MSWIRPGTSHESQEPFWALRDVSFEVARGDVVGVIGRNGAGKSTLLKILSRVIEPTEGTARIRGRVGALLEVGTGFHPELTGRENIFLSGALLGMSRAEIRSRFDAIVAFAEVEQFLDTPVKRYSSGMYVRLGFAIAAYLEPEILLIDEVLAVGDVAFQKRCLAKMSEAAGSGRTILFVSHNIQAVSALTQRCVLLSNGRCAGVGPTPEIIDRYLKEGVSRSAIFVDRPSVERANITRVELKTSAPANTQHNSRAMEVRFEISVPTPIEGASLSFQAVNNLGQPLLHLWTFDSERPMCRDTGTVELTCRIPKVRLYMGHYTLTVYLGAASRNIQVLEGICPFEVVMYGQPRERPWFPGSTAYLEDAEWAVNSGVSA